MFSSRVPFHTCPPEKEIQREEPPALSAFVDATIYDHPVKPCVKRGVSTVLLDAGEKLQKHFLCNIFR